jgi:hypothetical protein
LVGNNKTGIKKTGNGYSGIQVDFPDFIILDGSR